MLPVNVLKMASLDQDAAATTRIFPGQGIAQAITYHPARGQIDIEIFRSLQQHAGCRFAIGMINAFITT